MNMIKRYMTRLGLTAASLLLLAACAQGNDGKPTATVKVELTGPNAKLGNTELLRLAEVNMRTLTSYHMELKGGFPGDSLLPPGTEMAGDVSVDKGSRYTFIMGTERVEYLVTATGPYLSYDGGISWTQYSVDTPEGYLIRGFGTIWKSDGGGSITSLAFDEGSPAVEVIDGVPTRHMVLSAVQPGYPPGGGVPFGDMGAKTFSMWVSAGSSPFVHQMLVTGEKSDSTAVGTATGTTPYTLTWRWSRFNEDFGEVKPPPTETVKQP
jgi:hypothetical protein